VDVSFRWVYGFAPLYCTREAREVCAHRLIFLSEMLSEDLGLSDIESDSDSGEESDEGLGNLYEDVRAFAPDLAKQNWTYSVYSARGGAFAGKGSNVRTRNVQQDFKLLYNPSDDELFKKTKAGVAHALAVVREILDKQNENDKSISALEALVAVCPPEFFVQFAQWLKTPTQSQQVELKDLCCYFHCDVLMRVAKSSIDHVEQSVTPDIFNRYKKVKSMMQKADKPSSTRKATNDGTDPFKFDPIMNNAVDSINRLFKRIGFVPKETSVDLDDDKQTQQINRLKEYGL